MKFLAWTRLPFNWRCTTRKMHAFYYTLCIKKVPTFKLSVTLSNLNRFPKFFHCWKACEICYKTTQHYPPHLRHVATLPWDINNSNCVQYIQQTWKNANKLHFQCTDFNSCTRVNCVCWVYLCLFIKILSSSLNAILTVDKHCSDVCCDEFPVQQSDRKNKQVKEHSDSENFICNHYRGKASYILDT